MSKTKTPLTWIRDVSYVVVASGREVRLLPYDPRKERSSINAIAGTALDNQVSALCVFPYASLCKSTSAPTSYVNFFLEEKHFGNSLLHSHNHSILIAPVLLCFPFSHNM